MDQGLIGRGVDLANDVVARRPTSAAVRPLADEAVRLAALWVELVSGSCKVEDMLFAAETCTVVVRREPSPSGENATLNNRDIEILEQALLAGVRKSVAVDHRLCSSSIAEVLRRGFAFMGLSCWPSRIPLLLVMAAHAKHAGQSDLAVQRVVAENQHLRRQNISAPRPDRELASVLSAAEYGVTRLFVEGKSYAQIADRRRTSQRTVANQLASAFHRLDVSGRAELLCLLSRRQLTEWQTGVREPASALSSLPAEPKALARFARVAG